MESFNGARDGWVINPLCSNVGIGLVRMLRNLVGKKITSEFILMRPFIRFRWEEVRPIWFRESSLSEHHQIMLHSNNIFELMTTDPVFDDDESLVVYKSTDSSMCKPSAALSSFFLTLYF